MTQRRRLSILMDSTALVAVERELLVSTTKRHTVSVTPVTVLKLIAQLARNTDHRGAFANLVKCQHATVLPNMLSDAMTLLGTTPPTTHRYFLEPAFATKIIRIAASSGSYDDFMARSFVIHDEPVAIADLPVTAQAVLAPLAGAVNTQVKALTSSLAKELAHDDVVMMNSETAMRFVVAAVVVIADQRKVQLTSQQMSAVYGFVAACLMRAQLQLERGTAFDVDDLEFALVPFHLGVGETVLVSDDASARQTLTKAAQVLSTLVRRAPALRTAAVHELRGNGPVT